MKITKKFLRETVLPYLKKYPKRYRSCAYARRNGEIVDDLDIPKFDPAKPPPRGYKYDIEHLIIALHPNKKVDGRLAWNKVYLFLLNHDITSQRDHADIVRRLEEYVK